MANVVYQVGIEMNKNVGRLRIIFSIIIIAINHIKVLIYGSACKLRIKPGSIVFLKRVRIRGDRNQICVNSGVVLRCLDIIIQGSNNEITIGKGVKIYEKSKILIQGNNCRLRIVNSTTIGSAEFFVIEDNKQISIGEDCMFSRNITISTSDFHSILDCKTGKRINKAEDVYIGNHVWIGNYVTINKGVRLKADTVIGTKALVLGLEHDSNTILAGMPAKVVKRGIIWDRKLL